MLGHFRSFWRAKCNLEVLASQMAATFNDDDTGIMVA